ncbi:AAA family ATPase, partial [Oceanithermus sp.]
MQQVKLLSVHVENIRGFTRASFPLANDLAVFVGANNAGKTSLFIILKWLFSLDVALFERRESSLMTEEDARTLQPARNVRNKASRISLRVKINDGRKRRKFPLNPDGTTTLRFNFRKSKNRFYISVGRPKKGESAHHQDKAIELLSLILNSYTFVYISPNRISDIPFVEYSLAQMRSELREKPGPKSRARRDFTEGLDLLKRSTSTIADSLMKRVTKLLPNGYISDLSIYYDM